MLFHKKWTNKISQWPVSYYSDPWKVSKEQSMLLTLGNSLEYGSPSSTAALAPSKKVNFSRTNGFMYKEVLNLSFWFGKTLESPGHLNAWGCYFTLSLYFRCYWLASMLSIILSSFKTKHLVQFLIFNAQQRLKSRQPT